MPTIINGLNNNTGVQTFNVELNQFQSAPGRGAVTPHTNGDVYCVYAQTSVDFLTRSIYFAFSTDKGITWSHPIQLTSGQWDDDPAILQLDTTNMASDLGLVFNRDSQNPTFGGPTITLAYRCSVTTGGTINSPVDPVGSGTITATTGFYGFRFLNLNMLPGGLFIVSGLSIGGYPSIWINTTSFLTNNWVSYHNFTSSDMPNLPVSFKLRKLNNGDFAAIYAARTSLNGSWGSTPEGSAKTDVYFMASLAANNAQVWTTPQNLTAYTGSPTFDLVGFQSALDADVVPLNDGTLSVAYMEGLGSQFLSTLTTPGLSGTIGVLGPMVYHTQSNCLLIGGASTGFFTYNLTTGVINRYFTGSAQAIWSNNIKHIAVSTAGSYVAVTTDLSLEIFATGGNPDPSTWTLTSLRTTTTPATLGVPANVVFQDDGFLIVGWQNSGVANSALSVIDCGSIGLGFTSLTTTGTQTCDTYNNSLLYTSGYVHFSSGASYYHYDRAGASPGTNYSANCGLAFLVNACYDDVNNQFILMSGQGASATIISDNNAGSITSAVVSTALAGQNPSSICAAIPGAGMVYYYTTGGHGPGGVSLPTATGIGYYSFVTKKWFGSFEGQLEYLYQRPFFDSSLVSGIVPIGIFYQAGWLIFSTGVNDTLIRAIQTNQVGRMRLGNGSYSGGVLTLSTFYDMVNQTRVGSTQFNKVTFPNMCVTSDNTIVMYGEVLGYNYGTRPLTSFIGTVAPNSQTLSIRCDIKNTTHRTINCRAWLAVRTTRQIQCKVRIAHEACIKIGCKIAPRQARTLLVQASIKNGKTSNLSCTFNVASNMQSLLRGTFSVATGASSVGGIMIGASISRLVTKRITGHFTIPSTPGAQGFSFTASPSSRANVGIGAFIS